MINLPHILSLIKKSGGRYLFSNDLGDDFILMSIEEYEKILAQSAQVAHMSERGLVEKINKEVAAWRQKQNNENSQDSLNIIEPESESERKFDDNLYYFDAQESD